MLKAGEMHRIHYDEVSETFYIENGEERHGEFKTVLDVEIFLCDNRITAWTISLPAIKRMYAMGVRYVRSN